MKTPVSIEEVLELKNRLEEINKIPFKDILWTKNGVAMFVHEDMQEQWKFIGLLNSDFVVHEFYKKRKLWGDTSNG